MEPKPPAIIGLDVHKTDAIVAAEEAHSTSGGLIATENRQPGLPSSEGQNPAFAGNWSTVKKLFAVATGLLLNFNVTMSSSLPSGAVDTLASAFNITSHQQTSLPVAVFLIGYIFGPIIFGPMSESYGRRICFISSFALYTLFTLACALSPNWPSLLIFRFFVGIGASAPQTVTGGMYADLYPNLLHRGKAVMILGLTSNAGPLVGPIIAGYSSTTNWHWMFWISLIMAGANWPLLLLLPETFAPVILRSLAKAESSLKESAQTKTIQKMKGSGMKELVMVVLTRPIRMLFAEPLVFFTDLFLLYEYTIFFLNFESYPIIFKGLYGLSSGQAALALLPIGVGAVIAVFVFLWYDRFLAKSKAQGKTWAQCEEYRRLPLACAGGPLYAVSLFWLAWTARPNIHWIVPSLAGIPYGMGIDLTFMALNNYLTDAYGIYSASALASSVFSRNIIAALLLPLATYQMFEQLGIGWACSVLGFLCAALCPIPFIMIKYGPVLRERSPFCQQLKQSQGVDKQMEV
ncbi:MAG: hypothetical protein M1830_003250 [Pleopsidium flavum]|nr:MAG: hypothetical protein M1830_003250 [Pleopsidium flavum]